jgi:uncharacterized repeat protein (TIGR02543 family)
MKKVIIFLTVSLAITISAKAQVSVWDGSHTTWTNGLGTQASPYLIESAAQLAHLAYIVNNGIGAGGGRTVGTNTYYKLMIDIDLNGSQSFQWTPIGYYTSASDYYNFGGNFDGNGHTISNLFIETSTLQRIGLFGYTDGGTISNVGVVGNSSIIQSLINTNAYAGGIVGYAWNASIDNCYNTGNVSSSVSSSSNYSYSGGIVGYSTSTITNCYNTGTVSSSFSSPSYYPYSYSGGIVGYSTSTITNCYNTGTVSSSSSSPYNYSSYSYSGGIVGNSTSTITNCYNTGNVSSSSNYPYSGGIVGYSTSTITNCYNTGNVSSSSSSSPPIYSWSGGIVGSGASTINNSYYLISCGAAGSGESKTEIYMKLQEFVDLLNGTNSYYRLDILSSNNGYPVLTYFDGNNVPVNVVKTLPATNITSNGATLNGYVADSLIVFTKGFEYKIATDTTYTSITINNTDSSYVVSGLNSNTEYQYRSFANTIDGMIYGGIQTFSTPRFWDGGHSTWTVGDGTEANPYLIFNASQLAHLVYIVNNGLGAGSGRIVGINTYWKVMADIDLEGDESHQWTPIGYYNSDADYYAFGGHFDGNGYTISNLFINASTLQRIGLFGYTDGGAISNITVMGNVTRMSASIPVHGGGIVGYADNTPIDNCYNTGNVSYSYYSSYSSLGGIAGYSTSTITNCYNTGNVTSSNVTSSSYSGGIAGYSISTINNCYNTGNVSSSSYSSLSYSSYSGGIAGAGYSTSTINNCYNVGNIFEGNYKGGIVGISGNVTNSYYLVDCGGNNTYGGQSRTEVFMKSAEFVSLLNSGENANFVFNQDVAPFVNNGYPVFCNCGFVFTAAATNITKTDVTLHGYIRSGSMNIVSQGFQYKLSTNTNYITITISTTNDTLLYNLTGLLQGSAYQYRIFAISSSNDTAFGNLQYFTTLTWNTNNAGDYLIEDANDLILLATNVYTNNYAGSTFFLVNNIVLPANTPNNMISIGDRATYRPFSGTFDGNNKTISNVYIDKPNNPYQGFFGYTSNARIHNLGLVNITASGRNYTGGMVAYADNTYIDNSYVSGGTLFALSYVGGLVGYQSYGSNSIISGCYNTCQVTADDYVGGLVGYSNQATVRNSYVAALVTGQGTSVGAIIGVSEKALYYNCYFSVATTGQTKAIGEIRKDIDSTGMSDDDMRMQSFITTLNSGLSVPVWKMDYNPPINKGFPILIWQKGQYAITYNLNGGTNHPTNPVTYTEEDAITLKAPTKEGFDFVGWYDNANLSGNAVSGISAGSTGDREFWAKWKTPVGISETNGSLSNGISIYPNPAKDEISIVLPEQVASATFSLYDIQGKQLLQQNIQKEDKVLVAHLSSGIYIYTVIVHGQKQIGKIVKE